MLTLLTMGMGGVMEMLTLLTRGGVIEILTLGEGEGIKKGQN